MPFEPVDSALSMGVAATTSALLWATTAIAASITLGLGDVSTVGVTLLPAVLSAWLTWSRRGLVLRSWMHATYSVVFLVWLVPLGVLAVGDGSLNAWTQDPAWLRSLIFQTLCIPGIVGVAAAREFIVRGRGTPMPLDSPSQLVSSGPFAFVANPLQLAKILTLVALSLCLRSWALCGVAFAWFVLGAAVVLPFESRSLARRFGPAWHGYRGAVRPWLPRWRPWRSPDIAPARLVLARGCGPCDELERWFCTRRPVGLVVRQDAQLCAVMYTDGSTHEAGVVALARALEHLNLGWALFGWAVQVPVVRYIAQLIYNASVQRYGERRVGS